MKTKNKPHFLLMAGIVAVFAAFTVSCNKDDDPSLADLREDKLKFLEDSLRISDSLKRINAAGVVNYAITVVNGSTSTIFNHGVNPGREQKTQSAVGGAIVTISQYGKTMTDTTDASGMVVFTGFFRTTVNVNVRKEGFTTVSYNSVVNVSTATSNNTISFIGNLIPVFETTGANTATISGRATVQTNLTNKTREVAPDGTRVTASIDATNSLFASRFLTTALDNFYNPASASCGCEILDMGEILQASYQSGVQGTVTGGNYTLTVPAAVDGLPTAIAYSEFAADQTLFENTAANGQRTVVQRTIFNDNSAGGAPLATLPASSNVTISFASGSGAAATAVVSENAGTLDRINLTADGSNYIAATPPVVEITGGGGTGATATATVGANGRVTGITLTNPGTGYTSAPTVSLVSGSGATATAGLQANGTVTTVVITNSGSGYTSAPAVTFNAPGTPGGVTALGTANIDGSGRVTSISITTAGSGYVADPGAITIAAPPAGGVQATANAFYSGQSVSNVTVTGGANYTYAPTVTFSAPERANGVRATGIATFDAITRQVTGIQITNAGSGYTAAPTVTLQAGSGATANAFITGGTLINANVTLQGSLYAYAPTVVIGATVSGGGQGATATAIMQDGKVVGLNITNAGSGYTSAPSIDFVVGDNANAYATVLNGAIQTIVVTDGGRNFNGAPRVVITSADGGGATATATVVNGKIDTITVGTGGSGYLEGNTPGTEERFSATKGLAIQPKPGISYVNDVHYGTGAIRQPN